MSRTYEQLEPVISALDERISAKAEQIDTNTAEITELKNDGVAPSAEQLLSDNYVDNSVPYLFRQTGGDEADREYVDAIVGGSLAVNQLVPDFGTLTSSGSKAFNNGTAKIAGHKYLFSANISTDGNTVGLYSKADDVGVTEIILGYSVQSAIISAKKTATSDGTSNNSNGNIWLYPYIPNGSISNIMFIDLTAMFGSTIADHIYSLEQATAGAGVALFKSLFPKDYYAYDAGSMQSVSGLSEHKTVGFNVWDEEWEVGGISTSTGANSSETDRIRSKNYIHVFPNTNYYFKDPTSGNNLRVVIYDSNKNFVSATNWLGNTVVGTGSNGHYVRFFTSSAYGTTYKNDICINISDASKNGTYEPYDSHSYALDDSLTLRGIFKIDSNGNLYADGDIYSPSGKVTRRFGIVDLGTLTWEHNAPSGSIAYDYFQANISNITPAPKAFINSAQAVEAICAKYIPASSGNVAKSGYDKTFAQSNFTLYIADSSYTDATAFTNAVNGAYLLYELATPTTEQADPYISPQICDPNGTEEFVSTGIVPVGHETRYPENLRAKIEGLPWDFSSLIAPTEKSTTASRNYTIGNLLIMGNVLYKVTANIANGGTITPNTNVTATTLSEILSALAQ